MSNYDYIVIGAGSSGCAVAGRLSEAGHTVLLVEAGPDEAPLLMRMPAGFPKIYDDARYNWSYAAETSAHVGDRALALPRGRILGGSSAINALVFLRGHPEDYNGWASQGLPGWSYNDCLPYFRKLETSDQGPNQFRGGSGPVKVRQGRMESKIFDAWLAASQAAGHPLSDDLNGAQPEGMGHLDANIGNGRRCSAADAYVRPALAHGRLKLATSALVKRIIVDKGVAVGVAYEQGGQETIVRAQKEVILSAGAYNSPKILMLSGIGPADQLREVGVELRHDLPGVGKNLQDHMQTQHTYRTKGSISMAWIDGPLGRLRAGAQWMLTHTGPLASNMYEVGGFIKSSPEMPYPDLQYHILPMVVEQTGDRMHLTEGFTVLVTNCRPKSRGQVTLRDANPATAPKLHLDYLSHREDYQPVIDSMKLTKDIVHQSALDRIIDRETTPWPNLKTPDEIRANIATTALTIHHPVGTCKMGVGEDAVVDGDLKVRGIDRLRVIDASIMPNIITANTNCASMMIGEKGAAHVLAQA